MTVRYLIPIMVLASVAAGCSRTSDDLIKDLYSENSTTRSMAAQQLRQKGGDRITVQMMIDLLNKDNKQVAFIAAQVLGSMNDTTAVAPLCTLLVSSNNAPIRRAAAWSLGAIGYDAALPCLVEALKDPDAHVRYEAVAALGNLNDTAALPHLYPMLQDEADSIRVRTIESIYHFRTVKGANVMAADFALPLTDKNELVRYVAVQALGGAWNEASGWVYPDSTLAGELLMQALDDESQYVRIETINSLKNIRYKPAVQELKRIYDRASLDEEVAITQAIEVISGEAWPPIPAGAVKSTGGAVGAGDTVGTGAAGK